MNAKTTVKIYLTGAIPEISIVKRRLNENSNSPTSFILASYPFSHQ